MKVMGESYVCLIKPIFMSITHMIAKFASACPMPPAISGQVYCDATHEP